MILIVTTTARIMGMVVVVNLRRQMAVAVMVRREEINCHQQLFARSKGSYAQCLQVFLGQLGKHVQINFVRNKVGWKWKKTVKLVEVSISVKALCYSQI